jgi:multimeric flavodoxin WrbA
MNVVCVLGSPRLTGNSASIAERFCQTARGLGATATTYALNKLTYRGCQACQACKTTADRCVIEDDLTQVLESVRGADVVVLASPVYMGEVTGQMKCFLDRTYSFLVPDFITAPVKSRLAPGKKAVFVLTQGDPDEANFADIFPRYEFALSWAGLGEIALIRACGVSDENDAAARDDIMKLAEDTAQKMMA